MKPKPSLALLAGLILPGGLSAATVVNADFSRDIVNGTNPATANPAPVLYSGVGPAPDAGTVWNDVTIPLSAIGDAGANTIDNPITFSNLSSSTGAATTIDIQLTSGFFRSFNGTVTASNTVTALQNDRVFGTGADALSTAVLTLQGLNDSRTYDIYLINSGGFTTRYTIGGTALTASGNAFDGTWTDGGEYRSFSGISPASGEIAITLFELNANNASSISGIQIVEVVPEPSVALLCPLALLAFTRRRRSA
jgi:hypothetical protein